MGSGDWQGQSRWEPGPGWAGLAGGASVQGSVSGVWDSLSFLRLLALPLGAHLFLGFRLLHLLRCPEGLASCVRKVCSSTSSGKQITSS